MKIIIQICCVFTYMLSGAAYSALAEMDDQGLSEHTGEGIAITLTDWRFSMEPTGFIEQIGSTPVGGLPFQRGDLRWYGLTMSSALNSNGSYFTEGTCSNFGISGLGCPRAGAVSLFAPHDNPYVLRAFEYGSTGATVGQDNYRPDAENNLVRRTVLELVAPTSQDDYRFAVWGETLVNQGAGGILKSQSIIKGSAAGSVLRLALANDSADLSEKSLGIIYQSRLQGDFRFTVNQDGATSDVKGTPVQFNSLEGFYFRNVDAYLPLGALNYQALTLDVVRDGAGNPIENGNFVLEVSLLPSGNRVTRRHYSYNKDAGPGIGQAGNYGYELARAAVNNDGVAPTNANWVASYYNDSHGYVKWGDFSTNNPGGNTGVVTSSSSAVQDGVFFVSDTTNSFTPSAARQNGYVPHASGYNYGVANSYGGTAYTAVNLGDSRVLGLNIQHLKITSLGAN